LKIVHDSIGARVAGVAQADISRRIDAPVLGSSTFTRYSAIS
jgi:hypothetical protein